LFKFVFNLWPFHPNLDHLTPVDGIANDDLKLHIIHKIINNQVRSDSSASISRRNISRFYWRCFRFTQFSILKLLRSEFKIWSVSIVFILVHLWVDINNKFMCNLFWKFSKGFLRDFMDFFQFLCVFWKVFDPPDLKCHFLKYYLFLSHGTCIKILWMYYYGKTLINNCIV
jgi:hypothetical protein